MKTYPKSKKGQARRSRKTIRKTVTKTMSNAAIKERLMTIEAEIELLKAAIREPKRKIDPDDILTPAEAKIVRRGEAQLKRGESTSWRDVKNELSL